MAAPLDPDDSYKRSTDQTEWTGETAAFLVIERGDAKRTVRAIDRPVYVIGTAADCDMVLGDSQFADYHAYLYQRNGLITLRHLGPAPMLTVNGRVMRWGELQHLDRLRFGPYQLQLRLRPAAETTSTSQAPRSTVVHDFGWDFAPPWLVTEHQDRPGNGIQRRPPENRFKEYWN